MPLAFQNADLLQLELEQDHGVLEEGAEHEDDAGDHPALDGGQSLGLNMLFVSQRVRRLFCYSWKVCPHCTVSVSVTLSLSLPWDCLSVSCCEC